MVNEVFELRHILGLKIKEIRQEKAITYQELREKTGMSISYLSEIENGKKYPKGDKIILLADALGVSYDHLVSLRVPKKLQPIVDLIQSDFFKDFPLREFGLDPQKLVEIVSQDPDRINAFIRTIYKLSRAAGLTSTQLYYAALRSYQELHEVYFEELEVSAANLSLEFIELSEIPFSRKTLTQILLQLGVRASFDGLEPDPMLKNIRSVYIASERLLAINQGLTSGQINFLLAREIAFQWLRASNRSLSTPAIKVTNFDAVLNNYRSSYFAAALMMPEKRMVQDVKGFFAAPKWDGNFLIDLLKKYDVSPEMLFQRMMNILPRHFGLNKVFFVRFVGNSQGDIKLTKELHLPDFESPHLDESQEEYCPDWTAISAIKELLGAKAVVGNHVRARAQLATYQSRKNKFLCFTLAFPNVSDRQEAISVSIGINIESKTDRTISFLNDPSLLQGTADYCYTCQLTGEHNTIAHRQEDITNHVQSAIEELSKRKAS